MSKEVLGCSGEALPSQFVQYTTGKEILPEKKRENTVKVFGNGFYGTKFRPILFYHVSQIDKILSKFVFSGLGLIFRLCKGVLFL